MGTYSVIKNKGLGCGCGSVGRTVASNSRGPRFDPVIGKKLYNICLLSSVY